MGSWSGEEWREARGTGMGEGGRHREDALVCWEETERRRCRGRSRGEGVTWWERTEMVRGEDGETMGPARWQEEEEEKKKKAAEDRGWLERRDLRTVVWLENLKETQPRLGKLEEEEAGWGMDGDQLVWRRTRGRDRKQRCGGFQEQVTFSPRRGRSLQP